MTDCPQFSGAGALRSWNVPEKFLDDYRDRDGVHSTSLSCFFHCLRDALRGHGVDSVLPFLVRPLGVIYFVDSTLRPWLTGQPELEFDSPAFENGLRAQWRWMSSPGSFTEALTRIFASGRVAIIRANEWRVPWIRQTDLAHADWHTSVIWRYSSESLQIANRQYVGGHVENSEILTRLEDLKETIDRGIAVLDYSLTPDIVPAHEQYLLLLRRSIENAAIRFVRPAGEDYGLRAIEALGNLYKPRNFEALDSRNMRHTTRWHLPFCIKKYVVGNRKLLSAYLVSERLAGIVHDELSSALDVNTQAWEGLAHRLALSARKPHESIEELSRSIQVTYDSESELLETMTRILGARA